MSRDRCAYCGKKKPNLDDPDPFFKPLYKFCDEFCYSEYKKFINIIVEKGGKGE